MQQVDFYQLPRAVQERFIGCANGANAPAPLLSAFRAPREPLLWFSVSLGAALSFALLSTFGLGSLTSSAAQHAPWVMVPDALLLAACVLGALQGLGRWRDVRVLPYRPGLYLFPVGVIDAQTHRLSVHPGAELSAAEGPDEARRLRLTFASGAT